MAHAQASDLLSAMALSFFIGALLWLGWQFLPSKKGAA